MNNNSDNNMNNSNNSNNNVDNISNNVQQFEQQIEQINTMNNLLNEDFIEHNNNQLVEQNNNQLVEQKDNQLVEQKDNQLVEQKDNQLIEQNNNQLVEQNNNQLVEQNNNQLVEQIATPLITISSMELQLLMSQVEALPIPSLEEITHIYYEQFSESLNILQEQNNGDVVDNEDNEDEDDEYDEYENKNEYEYKDNHIINQYIFNNDNMELKDNRFLRTYFRNGIDFLNDNDLLSRYNEEINTLIMDEVLPRVYNMNIISGSSRFYKDIVDILHDIEYNYDYETIYYAIGSYMIITGIDISNFDSVRNYIRIIYDREMRSIARINEVLSMFNQPPVQNMQNMESVKLVLSKEELDKIQIVKFETLATTFTSCTTCLEDYKEGDDVRELPVCKHVFHKDCIDTWLMNNDHKCPVCRQSAGTYKANI